MYRDVCLLATVCLAMSERSAHSVPLMTSHELAAVAGGQVPDQTPTAFQGCSNNACCNHNTGYCEDVGSASECTPPATYYDCIRCEFLSPPCNAGGACCNPNDATCLFVPTLQDCPPPLQFTESVPCPLLDPPCGLGACCPAEGGCTEAFPADCQPPATFTPSALCLQSDPPCGLPGCGPCRLHADVVDFDLFCSVNVDDILYELGGFVFGLAAFPNSEIYPCDGHCGPFVDLDDFLSAGDAMVGNLDCPDPCPHGACMISPTQCEDFFANYASETACYLQGGTYCGDGTYCDDCPGFRGNSEDFPPNADRLVVESPTKSNESDIEPQIYRGASVAIACHPRPGPIVGGHSFIIDCSVSTDVGLSLSGIQLDLPCLLPGATFGGVTNAEVIAQNTAPGFLFGPIGMAESNAQECIALTARFVFQNPVTLIAGQSRYLASIEYTLADCTSGDLLFVLENFTNPPHECDRTKVRDGDRNLVSFTQIPFLLPVVPPPYGDAFPSGHLDVDDILCALAGFSNFASCPAADIASPVPCTADGQIDVDDLLAVLDAFIGASACPGPCD